MRRSRGAWCVLSGVDRWSVVCVTLAAGVAVGRRMVAKAVVRGVGLWRGGVCGSLGLWQLEGAACMGRLGRVSGRGLGEGVAWLVCVCV